MDTIYSEQPEAVPLCFAARLEFSDLAEHPIVEHPEHVNARRGAGCTRLRFMLQCTPEM